VCQRGVLRHAGSMLLFSACGVCVWLPMRAASVCGVCVRRLCVASVCGLGFAFASLWGQPDVHGACRGVVHAYMPPPSPTRTPVFLFLPMDTGAVLLQRPLCWGVLRAPRHLLPGRLRVRCGVQRPHMRHPTHPPGRRLRPLVRLRALLPVLWRRGAERHPHLHAPAVRGRGVRPGPAAHLAGVQRAGVPGGGGRGLQRVVGVGAVQRGVPWGQGRVSRCAVRFPCTQQHNRVCGRSCLSHLDSSASPSCFSSN
jgi:hypothetical protein